MFWQLSLREALKASPTHKAYRVGTANGVWVVEQSADVCILCFHPDTPLGAPPEPVQCWSFATLEELIRETGQIPGAQVIHTDWYPDEGEF
jgi:hypothetical protein